MGKPRSTAPAAPDPAVAAKAQGAANLETAVAQGWLNAMNQNSPYGSVNYTQSGTQQVGDHEVPQFTQNVTLSPEQQRQFNLQNSLQEQALTLGQGVLGNVGKAVSNPFSFDGIPKAPGSGDFSADRDAATQALIARNQPMMDRTRERQENQLANQGIMRGSEAYKNAMDDLGRQENDFRLAAVNAGGAEQNRLFGLGTQAHQQGVQDASFLRSQPINEYATLLGLGGNIQAPQFSQSPAGQMSSPDVMGAMNTQYSGQLANWNAKNQANQGMWGNIAGLGGALGGAFLASDIRLKTDIEPAGTQNGFNLYQFRYRDDPAATLYKGVMAQDVLEKMPEAVAEKDGYLAVNYNKIGIKFERIAA